MRVDYPQLESLQAKATKELAEALYDLVIAPVARLFTRT